MSAYDYIIVGSGAAGCVLAARLSESGRFSVLVLEAGEERKSPLLKMPAGETLLMGNPKYDWSYKTDPDPTIAGRTITIPRGKLLGGSNVINGMIFVRGQQEDYDEWERSGCSGWSFNELLPYFKKIESFAGSQTEFRGSAGPVSVIAIKSREPLAAAFIEAGVQAGYPLNDDYNGTEQEGFGWYQATTRRGERSSAVGTYFATARRRSNVLLLTKTRASNLLFEGRRCTGLTVISRGVERQIKVRREVIVAAGTVETPKLLELSGIGSPQVLEAAGIDVRVPLPGVGENFRDHFAVRMKWRVRGLPTFNERSRGIRLAGELIKYASRREGLLSLPIALAHGFVKSKNDLPRPDLQYHFSPASYGPESSRRLDRRPGMTVGLYPLRPRSRGSIHIGTAGVEAPPIIKPAFLSEREDLDVLLAGMKIARCIVAQPALSSWVEDELAPGAAVADDAALERFAVQYGDTSYHPVGSCRMGIGRDAVVDPRLRVRGVTGLRVVDASIMPNMVSGNTNAATLMIAEKGAAMILEDALDQRAVVDVRMPELLA